MEGSLACPAREGVVGERPGDWERTRRGEAIRVPRGGPGSSRRVLGGPLGGRKATLDGESRDPSAGIGE